MAKDEEPFDLKPRRKNHGKKNKIHQDRFEHKKKSAFKRAKNNLVECLDEEEYMKYGVEDDS